MGDYGMTSPKPGPITGGGPEPSGSGSLGDDMAHELHTIPGNPDKSILGGDNRGDLGKFAVAGNPAPEAAMGHDYGWQGDKPLFESPGNPGRDQVKSWFRGGSDALGFDGRQNGT